MSDDQLKDDNYWRDKLSDEEYRICREKGTERPFSGEYVDTTTPGVYLCKCCQTELFDSTSKFDSGCGWPSFSEGIDNQRIAEHDDNSLGMHRVEITCSKCNCHLGHVFTDGPQPTGLRYCVNSASVTLREKDE